MQKQRYFNFFKIISFVFIIGCFSFFDLKLAFAVNTSTATDNEKRILLEAAHGSGYNKNGWDECNHASNSVDGKTYYENLEARIMIDKIAGYLKQANIPYEISNEIVGDAYFNNPNEWQSNGCNPNGNGCCGFRQGTIGNYSPMLYKHIDSIGADKYLFAFELHFNGFDGKQKYSAVMLDSVTEPYSTNGRKLTNAVDKVIGTSGSMVSRDVDLFGDLTAINNLQSDRGIPTYYLETFFMDYTPHLKIYLSKKDELAKELAQVLIEMAGSDARLNNVNSGDDDEEEWSGGRTDDPFSNYPLIISNNDFTCKAILVDINTGELNNLGNLLQDIFNLIKILGPVLAISLSLTEFNKVATAVDPTAEQKKAMKRVAKRLAIGLILLFLPYLLDLLLHVFGLYDISSCGIG